jgi:RNA polymerase sigma factor (sigma-70 family)
MDDAELLQRYALEGSDEAFRLLLQRNVPLVFSAALRKTGDRSLAEDVTQVVFIILAKKARRLSKRIILAGWLHRTTHHAATKAVRKEYRRREREKAAVQMQISEADSEWKTLAPLLDDAIAQLGELDRSALLLRFFQNRSFDEVGRALGMSDDTAQKRVSRCILKLRRILGRRGVSVPLVTLSSLAGTHGAQFAPGDLASQVATTALRDKGVSSSVYSLLERSIRPVFWPKILGGTFGGLALVAVLGLVTTFWPQATPSSSSGMSLQSGIVHHPPRVAYVRPAPPTPVKPAAKETKAVAAVEPSKPIVSIRSNAVGVATTPRLFPPPVVLKPVASHPTAPPFNVPMAAAGNDFPSASVPLESGGSYQRVNQVFVYQKINRAPSPPPDNPAPTVVVINRGGPWAASQRVVLTSPPNQKPPKHPQ